MKNVYLTYAVALIIPVFAFQAPSLASTPTPTNAPFTTDTGNYPAEDFWDDVASEFTESESFQNEDSINVDSYSGWLDTLTQYTTSHEAIAGAATHSASTKKEGVGFDVIEFEPSQSATLSPDSLSTSNPNIELIQSSDSFYAYNNDTGLIEKEIKPAKSTLQAYNISTDGKVLKYEKKVESSAPILFASSDSCIGSINVVTHKKGHIIRVYRGKSPSSLCTRIPQRAYDQYKVIMDNRSLSKFTGQKYRDQLVCHVVNAWNKKPWNLESWRPDVGYTETVLKRCNP